MAKGRKKPIEDEELEELEALEDLEDLEEDEDEAEDEAEELEDDEEEDEDEEEEEDDDEDDEDDEPAPRSKRKAAAAKSTKTKTAPRKGSRPDDGKVGTQEVAAHFGVDGRTLRIVLRKHNVAKDPDSGQYRWSSLKNKEVIRIGKLIASGEAKKAKTENLDKLKAKKAAAKATPAQGTAKKKKRTAA